MIIKIDKIRELLMDQDDFIVEFSEASIESFSEFSTAFSKYMKTNDLENLRRAGHKIKPVAQMLDAEQIVELYEEGKMLLTEDAPKAEILQTVDQVEQICSQIVDEFDEIIRTTQS